MTTNYIDALHDAGRGLLVDQVDFYERLALKLPLVYREAYQDWYTDRFAMEECTALSLLDWCRAQVIKIRRADLNSGINVVEEPRVRQTTRRTATAATANAAAATVNACHEEIGEAIEELPNYVSAAMEIPNQGGNAENVPAAKQSTQSQLAEKKLGRENRVSHVKLTTDYGSAKGSWK